MRSQKQQAARIAKLCKKADVVGARHGKELRKARITTGQAVQVGAAVSWSYVRATARNA